MLSYCIYCPEIFIEIIFDLCSIEKLQHWVFGIAAMKSFPLVWLSIHSKEHGRQYPLLNTNLGLEKGRHKSTHQLFVRDRWNFALPYQSLAIICLHHFPLLLTDDG
jgi:hypothetical protein